MCRSWYSSSFRVSRIRLNCNCHWIADESFWVCKPCCESHRLFHPIPFLPWDFVNLEGYFQLPDLKTIGMFNCKSPHWNHQTLQVTTACAPGIYQSKCLQHLARSDRSHLPQACLENLAAFMRAGLWNLVGPYLHTVFVCCLHSIRTCKGVRKHNS